jgi:hypothetical protein
VKTVTISRLVTVVILIGLSAAIVGITIWTAGKSYTKVDPRPFDEVRQLAQRLGNKPISTHVLAVILVPIIGNILLFVPWGFLMFISLYGVDRPTVQTYLLTVLLGFSFSLVIEAWQYFIPSRVADVNDVISNTIGTIAGAVLGHMRLRVRFEFE